MIPAAHVYKGGLRTAAHAWHVGLLGRSQTFPPHVRHTCTRGGSERSACLACRATRQVIDLPPACPPGVRGGSAAIPTAGKVSERPCMRLHSRLTKKVPRSGSSLGRRAPAWGTRLRSRSSQRPREACGAVHAGARPQVRWPRVSRGGRLVTEVRRQRQSSSPQPDESGRERSHSNGWENF